MARPRSYDLAAARQGVVETFLRHGYAAASISDLEAGSGLNRRQLYNDFGDKKTVFVTALNDFAGLAAERFLAGLETGTAGLDDVAAALRALVAEADTAEGRLGCLICNSSREPIAADTDVAPVIGGFFRRIERAYEAALIRAADVGEFPPGDVGATARQLFGVHVSLCVLGRAGESADVLHDIAEATLAGLDRRRPPDPLANHGAST